ncbi:hypothetical protein QUV86_22505, partial [Xanthomonas citri pv. citri]
HWIFNPKSISLYGLLNDKWQLISTKTSENLTEDYSPGIKTWEFFDTLLPKFSKIKVVAQNYPELPTWRKRKNKKPMIMLDEIQFVSQ